MPKKLKYKKLKYKKSNNNRNQEISKLRKHVS